MLKIDRRRRENRTEAQRKAQTAAAIAARKDLPSTRERGLQNQLKVIDWIYKWGYSTSPIIQSLLQKQSNNFTTAATKKGLLIRTATESGTPNYYYTLSEVGLELATKHASQLLRYPEIDPYRVNQSQIRHYLLAQHATLKALQSNKITDYLTERMIDGDGDKAGVKRPDIIFNMSDIKAGVEIELSAKWDRKLDQFLSSIGNALKNETYQVFIIFSDSPALLNRYQLALTKPIKHWVKDDRGHWQTKGEFMFPVAMRDWVQFQLIKG